jgi:hypothetical protein
MGGMLRRLVVVTPHEVREVGYDLSIAELLTTGGRFLWTPPYRWVVAIEPHVVEIWNHL